MTLRTSTPLRRAALAAALVVGSGFLAAGTAQAAPLAPPPADAIAAENGVINVRHGWGGHHGWGHHHHGWGHRGHHWGHRHHGWGWGHHRHHHHHGWGGGHRHRHHHHW